MCSRRHELRLADWLEITARLRDAGKQVVLSTQVLLESGADVSAMHKIANNGDFLAEANDMGAVHDLAGKPPFVAGPQLNLYNLPSLQWMAKRTLAAVAHGLADNQSFKCAIHKPCLAAHRSSLARFVNIRAPASSPQPSGHTAIFAMQNAACRQGAARCRQACNTPLVKRYFSA